MKKLFNISLLFLLALTACKQESLSPKSSENSTLIKDVNAEIGLFSQTLNKALVNPELRAFLKTEALKKFDYDYDILYENVKSQKLSSGKTFEETLLQYGKLPTGNNNVASLTQGERKHYLNIYIYSPEGSPENWVTESTTPKVVASPDVDVEEKSVQIPAFNQAGEVVYFDSKKDPNEVIIVVGYNERVDNNGVVRDLIEPTPSKGLPLKTRGAFRVQGGAEKIWQINLPCLSCLEAWIKGSPELMVIPVAQGVGKLTVSRFHGINRNQWGSGSWVQINSDVLASWNTSEKGTFLRYHWYEEDDGIYGEYTENFNYIKQDGTTFSYDIVVFGGNDNCGFNTVFFNDLTWTDYRVNGGSGKEIRWYMGPFN
jgi:hypothetical protein